MSLMRSLAQYFAYLGPTLIVSMAYIDPGNYGTDLAAGASFNYDLVWSVWLASMMAMVLQYLSGKLGIATGKSLPELLRISLKSRTRTVTYWLAAEVATAATDLAEYLGTVIALNILFGIPLIYAAILGALDVLILLVLTSRRFRVLEYIFMLFVSVISLGFLYEVAIVGPNLSAVALHSVLVSVNSQNAIAVVGIIGATVMPHTLYLHSHLTKGRLGDNSIEEKRRLRRLHLSENVTVLTVAGLVNVAILVISAAAFYPRYSDVSSINDAYRIMIPLFGALAATVFAITLLCSGLASSTTGTLAGQAIMEGLLGVKVNRYLRRIITRFVNVFPTTIAILLGINPLSLLVYSQVVLSLLIPLPMIPLLMYTSNKSLMGEFANKRATNVMAAGAATIIIALNAYLIYSIL